MGVWIETFSSNKDYQLCSVTPCMGVWIETEHISEHHVAIMSHPVWVCGLKLLSG